MAVMIVGNVVLVALLFPVLELKLDGPESVVLCNHINTEKSLEINRRAVPGPTSRHIKFVAEFYEPQQSNKP